MCAERTSFDAVIVGSGIAGALIAKQLGLKGKKVLILEAGAEMPDDVNEYMNRFYKASAKVPEIPYTPALFDEDSGKANKPFEVAAGRPTVLTLGPGAWNDPTQSYLIQDGKLPFASTYERINGGTVRHWLGTSLRFVPNDFKMASYNKDLFVDWPITFADLDRDADNSWYGKAEREIGVSADVSEQERTGTSFAPGYTYPMPGIPLSLVDKHVQSKIDGMTRDGIELVVTSTPAARNSQPYQNRRVCAGNTNCIPICPIQAKYDPSVTLADALRTGNVEVRYKHVAHNVVVDGNGRVSRIDYLQYKDDKGPRTGSGSVTAKVFILAGNAIETPRLLMMSTNEGRTPNGVANGGPNHLLGKNLMDHPLYLAWALASEPVFPYRGPLSTGGIETMRDGPFRKQRGAFRIEIGNEGWNFPIGDPHATTMDFINGLNFSQLNDARKPLFGAELRDQLNSLLSRQFRLGFLVEQTPDEKNRVTLGDRTKKNEVDRLGLPRPKITYDLSDYTKAGLVEAKKTADAIFDKMGAKQFTKAGTDNPSQFMADIDGKQTRVDYYGAGHIVGTYRMGTDKSNSVVDREQRSWDHPNLYMVGSGVFPTVATANPTLTLAALCLWCADTILKKDLH